MNRSIKRGGRLDIATNSGVTVAALDTGLNPHPDMPAPKRTYDVVSNTSIALGFATPGGTELWFPKPEIPR